MAFHLSFISLPMYVTLQRSSHPFSLCFPLSLFFAFLLCHGPLLPLNSDAYSNVCFVRVSNVLIEATYQPSPLHVPAPRLIPSSHEPAHRCRDLCGGTWFERSPPMAGLAESGRTQTHPGSLTSGKGILTQGLPTAADTQEVFSTLHPCHTIHIWREQWPFLWPRPIFPSF